MSIFRKSSAQIPTPRKNNSSAFAFFHESIERTQIKKALQLQSFQKTRGPFFDKNVRKTDLIHMVRVGRLELPASCSQTFELKFFYFFRCFIAVFSLLRTLFATLDSTVSAHSTAVCSQTCGQKPLSEHPHDRGQKAVFHSLLECCGRMICLSSLSHCTSDGGVKQALYAGIGGAEFASL